MFRLLQAAVLMASFAGAAFADEPIKGQRVDSADHSLPVRVARRVRTHAPRRRLVPVSRPDRSGPREGEEGQRNEWFQGFPSLEDSPLAASR